MSEVKKQKGGYIINRKKALICAVLISITLSMASVSAVSAWSLSEKPVDDKPILLVHGYADTCDTAWWDVLKTHLMDAGYAEDSIYTLSLGPLPLTTVGSPERYANEVYDKVVEIYQSEGSEVDIIAHSMGGLDSRWAIEKLGAAKYVDDLITLGTPHQGTYAAYLGLITPGGRDMVPGSDFLQELNDGQLAEGVEYTAVWSSLDEANIPHSNAKIPDEELNSVAKARNVWSGYQFHIQLVWDETVFNQYYEYLD